jgi:hypothetical protein
MKWATGNWTSAPADGRAFLERHEEGHWFAYQTDEAGTWTCVNEECPEYGKLVVNGAFPAMRTEEG